MLTIQTILHPTDFSEHAARAFRLACALARDYGAKVYVLHVAPPPVPKVGKGMIPLPDISEEELKHRLNELKPHDPKVTVERRLVEGLPAEEIVRFAGEKHCDLVMMGTHGLTGLAHLFLGSVAEQVMRKAPCPVLTMRVPAVGTAEAADPRSDPQRTEQELANA